MTDWELALAGLQEACRDTFGVPVSYIPSINNRPELLGHPISLFAVFDENREIVSVMNGGGGGGMDAVIPRPVLEMRLVDLGIDPAEGDTVVIADITYKILDIQLDGLGAAVLVLHRISDS